MSEEPLPQDALVGYVVGGTLKDSLSVRLTVPPQQVQEGSFVVIESNPWQFYGLVTDLQLGATDPRFADEQSEKRLPPGLAKLLHGQTLFTNLEVLPALMLERGPEIDSPEYPAWAETHIGEVSNSPIPVKTIPPHHSPVRLAAEGDIYQIFGKPSDQNFIIGYTREQGHSVCIDLNKFVKRSSGIFGATGSGKSFLTRILLAGLIKHDRSSLLVFDMHNEYAYDTSSSDTGEKVTGLKTKFLSKIRVVGLGTDATYRNHTLDFNLVIGEKEITPEDIEMLTRELNLKETTPTTLEALIQTYGKSNWYSAFKTMKNQAMVETDDGKKIPSSDSVAAWANQAGVNVLAAEGLHSKLRRLFNCPYIKPEPPKNALNDIIKLLYEGKHVVLSFGAHETDLDYLLVTNLLTRRIREEWQKFTNDFNSGKAKEPRPLVVVVEEAHKLLNREMAAQTTFSTIAREMRKYYVTLLIIDQRPSQIYDEVMSQLGTRISASLGDEADIAAVLSGLPGRDSLRGMLSRLQPKEEVLLLGWGVNMPLPVRSRRYDKRFWDELVGKEDKPPTLEDLTRDLYGG